MAAVSSIAVQTTYHLTRGTAPSSSSALSLAGVSPPTSPSARTNTDPSPTCSLRPTQTQTRRSPHICSIHNWISSDKLWALSFCRCSIHSRLPWITIPGENLHKFTQPFASDHRFIHTQEMALPPVFFRTLCWSWAGLSFPSLFSFCVLVQGSLWQMLRWCQLFMQPPCCCAVPKGFNGVLTSNLIWLRNE